MFKIFLTLCVIVSVFVTNAQPYAVGHLQKSFTDPSRSNRSIPCEIYYPATASGNNTPIVNGKFPVVVFGHGFVMAWSAYDIFWKAIVPNGYIMIFPTTESSFSPSHLNLGKDMAFLCNAMKTEGNSNSSFFYNTIDSTNAVMGHSMGGGCSFLAMQEDSSITAMASFAAAVTNPSSVTAATSIHKPTLVFSGANDCVAPPADHQIPMYNSLASSCKTFLSITGGNHCQFAATNINCSFGQGTCTPQATINANTQQSIMFERLIPWMDFYLKKNCAAGDSFQALITVSGAVVAQQNCILGCNANPPPIVDTSSLVGFEVYPNPAKDVLQIKANKSWSGMPFYIYGIGGNKLKSGNLSGELTTLNIASLSSGLYIIRLENKAKKLFLKRL